MSRRWPTARNDEEELPASGAASRLLVMGFIAAAGIGLLAGVIWIGWNLIVR